MRIVLNPDPADGGGAIKETPAVDQKAPDQAQQGQQPKAPDQAQQSPAKPEESVKPPTVTLTPEQFARYQAAEKEAKEFRDAERKRLEAENKAEEERLRESGKVQELLARRDRELAENATKLREYEARTKNSERSRALALAMNGQPLVSPAAAAQLTTILLPELDVTADGEGWHVASRDGKDVAAFVKDKLASPEYAHFLSADRRGGSGATARAQQPAPAADRSDNLTPGHRLIEALKAQPTNLENTGIGWGRN